MIAATTPTRMYFRVIRTNKVYKKIENGSYYCKCKAKDGGDKIYLIPNDEEVKLYYVPSNGIGFMFEDD